MHALILSLLLWPGGSPGQGAPVVPYPEAIRRAGEEALSLVQRGQFEAAIPLWQRLLAWQQQALGASDLRSLRTLRNLAAVQLAAGHAPEAIRLYDDLRERLRRLQGGATDETVQVTLELARAWRTDSGFSQAEQLTRGVLAILAAREQVPEGRLLQAEAQDLLGTILHEQGRYPEAEAAYRAALALRRPSEGNGGARVATIRSNLAQALLRQGRYAEALDLQRRVLADYRADTRSDTRRQQATVLPNIALSQSLLGQPQASLATLRQALVLKSDLVGADHPETARLLLNLGSLEADQGDSALALRRYREALRILRTRLGPDQLGTAFALQRMAELARQDQQPEQARAWGSAALAIRRRRLAADHPDIATTLLGLGLSELATGDRGQAVAHLREAVEIRERALGKDHPYTAMASLLLGLTLWEGGQPQQAAPRLEQAVTAFDHFLRQQAPLLPARERGRLLATVQESRNAFYSLVGQGPGGRDLALMARLHLHGRLEEIERRQAEALARHPERLALARSLEAIRDQLEQDSPDPATRQRLERRQLELRQALGAFQGDAGTTSPVRVTAARIAAGLSADAALIEYLHYRPVRFRQGRLQSAGEARLAAVVLSPDAQARSIDLGPASRINAAIWAALAETQRAGPDSEQAWVAVADLVLRPLLPLLNGRRTWYVSADGELHRIPFAVLASRELDGLRPYGDSHVIRLLTSGRDLLELPPPQASGAAAPALIVADPDFEAAPATSAARSSGPDLSESRPLAATWRRFRWSRLAGSRREGESLRRLLGGRLLLDALPDDTSLHSMASPALLHVASHGAFLPAPPASAADDRNRQGALEGRSGRWEDPMQRSVVVLVGANRRNPQEQDAGYLTAGELSRLPLQRTRLVTLSACETGKGRIEIGDGVYGMRRAIAIAGASSSLLSLWKVDDQATRALMELFYAQLQRGRSPEDALRTAQQRMRSHERRDWRHPYVWAAFQLYGRSW